jgi:S-adenosylmethionine synthetase
MGRKNETVTKTFKGSDGKILKKSVELFTWEKLDYVNTLRKEFRIK